jgi:hypothetical protein
MSKLEASEALRLLIAKDKARLARFEDGFRFVTKDSGQPVIDRTDETIADLRQSIALNEAALSLLTDR